MFLALNIGWIVFWGLGYTLIVRRGFKDQTFGFPLVAIGTDFAWVLIFTFIYPQTPFMVGFVILDLIFLYQLIKYRRSDLTSLSREQYFAGLALTVATAFALILAFSIEFDDRHGIYTSLADSLVASVLMLALFHRRPGLKGQSLYIALFKLLGNLSAAAAFSFFAFPDAHPRLAIHLFHRILDVPLVTFSGSVPDFRASVLVHVLGGAILIYDVIYVVLVYRRCRQAGIDPWRRF